MISYLLRRMALVVPTLLCIIVINFIIAGGARWAGGTGHGPHAGLRWHGRRSGSA